MAAHQVPPSLGFSRQERWSGLPFLLQCMKWKVKVESLGHVRLLATPWTAAHQAPPSVGFSRQEYWSEVPLPSPREVTITHFQQHKRRLYTWTSPDGQHRNQIDYILCSQRWRSSIQSAKTRPGADYGSDHELLIAKFRLKLKKVGKTTRPKFRYDLNQIPYDYAVEVTNRFKGSDLIDKVPEEPWMEVCDIVQEKGIKTIPMEKKCKKQNGCQRRLHKYLWKEEKWKAKEKRKHISIWMQSFRK